MSEKNILREYISNLPDEDIKFLEGRLNQRLSGDIAEVLNFMERTSKVDSILSKTRTADDLYDIVDSVHSMIEEEYQNRPRLVEYSR